MKKGFVYILTNKVHTVFYVGVTSDIKKRILQHRVSFYDGFTKRYNVKKLIWYADFENIHVAITWEKKIKKRSIKKKLWLISTLNPTWDDLSL